MKKKTVYILPAVLIILAVGLCLYFGLFRYSPELDVNAVTSPTLHVPVTKDSSGVYIAEYPELRIPAGETEVSLNLMNPKGNRCYFTFSIALKDTGEVIYTSKAVKSGTYIGTAELNRALDAGEYNTLITVTTHSACGSAEGEITQDARLLVK